MTSSGCAVGKAGGGTIEAIGEGASTMGMGVFRGLGVMVGGTGRAIRDASGGKKSVARAQVQAARRQLERY